MDKQGLVAPVWSDSGDVTVGEVAYGFPIPTVYDQPRQAGRIIWTSDPVFDPVNAATVRITNPTTYMYDDDDEPVTDDPEPISLREWFAAEIAKMVKDIPGIAQVFEFPPEVSQKLVKPADPNAKPSLPALTRVSGNKRGPGWCDE